MQWGCKVIEHYFCFTVVAVLSLYSVLSLYYFILMTSKYRFLVESHPNGYEGNVGKDSSASDKARFSLSSQAYCSMNCQHFIFQVGTLTSDGKVALLMDTSLYSSVRSQCSEDCLVCLGVESNFRNFSYRVGDLYIIGNFCLFTRITGF